MNQKELPGKWQQIIVRAWSDEVFKKRLLADPAAVLKESGLEMPEGVQIRMVENTDKVIHLVLPRKTDSGELEGEDLEQAVGGVSRMCGAWDAYIR